MQNLEGVSHFSFRSFSKILSHVTGSVNWLSDNTGWQTLPFLIVGQIRYVQFEF
jgi:hypothetical protein